MAWRARPHHAFPRRRWRARTAVDTRQARPGDLNLEPDALEGAVLPITDLTLWRCGDHADAIAETLKADKTGLKTEVAARPWDFRVD